MAIIVTKDLILVEDFEFGFDASTQVRTGTQYNAAYLPYSVSETVTQALDARYTSVYMDNNFAAIAGSALNIFSVADGAATTDAVNFQQLALKADITTVDLKADKTNVLELDNNDNFTPLFDFNPSTKRYVDDSISTAFQSGTSGSFTAQSGETITVVNGLITGIV